MKIRSGLFTYLQPGYKASTVTLLNLIIQYRSMTKTDDMA